MSEIAILYRRIGKQGVERLVKLGLLKAPDEFGTLNTTKSGNTSEPIIPTVRSEAIVINDYGPRRAQDKIAIEDSVLRQIEETRRIASDQLDRDRRADLGQFMTPAPIADFMASLFQNWPREAALLEPGAGIGNLAYAFGKRFFEQNPSGNLSITAYEIEQTLADYLSQHLISLRHGRESQIDIEVLQRDFVREAAFAWSFQQRRFTHIILNPPYKKIGAQSEYRRLLRLIGVESGNLYAAFLALAIELASDGGEIVAIIPRSFCNGMYFRPFRKWLLSKTAISHIHVFESRKEAFSDDKVLQENIIIRLVRRGKQKSVVVSTSHGAMFGHTGERKIPFEQIVKSQDPEQFIHIPTFDVQNTLAFTNLAELGLDVATGPVVDFRLREHSLAEPKPGSAPLLYAHHFSGGELNWPRQHKKPNALLVNDSTKKWLMPNGWYTITRRFSAKEEKRRIVAYVVDPRKLPQEFYGFENHLNVIHSKKAGINANLARGLSVYLNSTVADRTFRNFSGHTQVNATDLRSMKFPNKQILLRLGRWAAQQQMMDQTKIDAVIEAANGDEATKD